jgi:AbrB family looped-hinge helix DNA binding protein
MTYRVGPKGQVVIPKPIRDALDLQPGDEVHFELKEGVAQLQPARVRRRLGGLFAGHDLIGMLEADRRSEPR